MTTLRTWSRWLVDRRTKSARFHPFDAWDKEFVPRIVSCPLSMVRSCLYDSASRARGVVSDYGQEQRTTGNGQRTNDRAALRVPWRSRDELPGAAQDGCQHLSGRWRN